MAKKKAVVEPEAPVEPVVDVAPVVEPVVDVAPVEVAPVVDPDEHPLVRPLGDGRWVERRINRERTVTIHGERYEHVADDADGRWIYAKS